jgi:hypothetical protein
MPNQQNRYDEGRGNKDNSRCRQGDFPGSISRAFSITRPATGDTADEHIILTAYLDTHWIHMLGPRFLTERGRQRK